VAKRERETAGAKLVHGNSWVGPHQRRDVGMNKEYRNDVCKRLGKYARGGGAMVQLIERDNDCLVVLEDIVVGQLPKVPTGLEL
jgi:hypothetical protein